MSATPTLIFTPAASASAATAASTSDSKTMEERACSTPKVSFKKNPITAILGTGMAGLTAAPKLLEAGHTVILIDNRSAFTRHQRIVLSSVAQSALFSLSSLPARAIKLVYNEKGIASLSPPASLSQADLMQDPDYQFFTSKNMPTIKDIQALLYRACIRIAKSDANTQDTTNTITLDKTTVSNTTVDQKMALDKKGAAEGEEIVINRLSIMRGPRFEISGIDGNNQRLQVLDKLKNKTLEIAFDYCVAADGAKHTMANLLAQNPAYKIPYKKLPPVRHVTCGSIAFKLKPGTIISGAMPKTIVSHLNKKSAITHKDLDILKKLTWEKDYLPVSYIARDDDNIFYLIGEMPTAMGEQDIQAREQWARTILAIEFARYNLSANDFILHSHEDTKNPLFKIDLEAAETNVMALGKSGGFFLIGDARQRPNFFYGHGVEDAFADAEMVFRCFDIAKHLSESSGADNSKEVFLDLQPMLAQHQVLITEYKELHEKFLALLQAKQPNANLSAVDYNQAIQYAQKALHKTFLKKHNRFQESQTAWVATLQTRADLAFANLERITNDLTRARKESAKKYAISSYQNLHNLYNNCLKTFWDKEWNEMKKTLEEISKKNEAQVPQHFIDGVSNTYAALTKKLNDIANPDALDLMTDEDIKLLENDELKMSALKSEIYDFYFGFLDLKSAIEKISKQSGNDNDISSLLLTINGALTKINNPAPSDSAAKSVAVTSLAYTAATSSTAPVSPAVAVASNTAAASETTTTAKTKNAMQTL